MSGRQTERKSLAQHEDELQEVQQGIDHSRVLDAELDFGRFLRGGPSVRLILKENKWLCGRQGVPCAASVAMEPRGFE